MSDDHIKNTKDLLLLAVSKTLSKDAGYEEISGHGEIEVNAFSITFWVDFNGSKGVKSIYVKIPKYIFYDESINFFSPITDEDVILARGEYASLEKLLSSWDYSHGISFVKPLGFIEKYNVIITERVFGSFLFKEFRKKDSENAQILNNSNEVSLGLYNFGKALKVFHDKSSIQQEFLASNFFDKFKLYTNFLERKGVNTSFLTELLNTLSKFNSYEGSSFVVKNFKGIDIRQILVDKENNLHVMDPGKLSPGFREISIARFIVTCRILYWGTIRAVFSISPNRFYEDNFIKGYFGKDPYDSHILSIFILKEILKQWKVLHEALDKRNWPSLLKFFFRKCYIDPFYKKQINKELEFLKKKTKTESGEIKT